MMNLQLKSIELSEQKKNKEDEKANANKSTVKLHPIKPMEFNGEVTDYPGFISNWNATVDCQDITDGVKLRYLQDALGPIPRKCIASLKSDNEYSLALALLEKRYGNRTVLKREYIRKLECLPKLTDPNDILKLRLFADELDICCHALTEYGIDSDTQDIMLLNTIEKLPHDLRYQFTKSVGGIHNLNLTKLMNLLNEHMDIVSEIGLCINSTDTADTCDYEQAFFGRTAGRSQFRRTDDKFVTQFKPKRRSSQLSNSNPKTFRQYENHEIGLPTREFNRTSPTSPCKFCHAGNHWNEDCPTFVSRESRIKKLGKCCLKCFMANHETRECRRTIFCPHCQSKNSHNRSLCPMKYSNLETTHVTTEDTTDISPESSTEVEESLYYASENRKDNDSTLATSENGKARYVIFPTAVSYVKSTEKGSVQSKCRIAFDTLSSRSYHIHHRVIREAIETQGRQGRTVISTYLRKF